MTITRARIAVAAALVGATILLTGCGPTLPGAAAVVGTDKITESEVASQVQEIQKAAHSTTGADKITSDVVSRMVVNSIITQLADKLGVTVTDGALDQEMNKIITAQGGLAQLEAAALNSNVPPSAIRDQIKVSMLETAIANKLAPGASSTQQQSVLVDAVIKESNELGTQVAPKFGSWQIEQIKNGAAPLQPLVEPFLSTPNAAPSPSSSG